MFSALLKLPGDCKCMVCDVTQLPCDVTQMVYMREQCVPGSLPSNESLGSPPLVEGTESGLWDLLFQEMHSNLTSSTPTCACVWISFTVVYSVLMQLESRRSGLVFAWPDGVVLSWAACMGNGLHCEGLQLRCGFAEVVSTVSTLGT